MKAHRYDKDAVRARLGMPRLCAQLGIELRRSGLRWIGRCPFHAERSASFTVTCEDGKGWHYHCFGCAANGNLAAMIANPEDLVHGREGNGLSDATTASRAIGVYRTTPPTGTKGLQDISTKSGGK